jgi:hypothetical protein
VVRARGYAPTEQAALRFCIWSQDPWTCPVGAGPMGKRRKPAFNALAITFEGRYLQAQCEPEGDQVGKERVSPIANSALFASAPWWCITRTRSVTREAIMARLVVEAQGTAATGASQGATDVDLATPGNSGGLPLVVSVTDTDGVPVTGLIAANFTVDARLVAPYGSGVDIRQPNGVAGGYDGFYYVSLVPPSYQGTQHTWRAGRYVFSVVVNRGGDHGQTVSAVFVD